MIKFRCPHCDQKIGLSEQYANKQVRCAKCKKSLVVPAASTETDSADKTFIRFQCRACQRRLKVSQKYAGRNIKCPKCGVSVVVPQITEALLSEVSSSGSTVSDELLESHAETGDFLQELGLEKIPPPMQQEGSLQFQPAAVGDTGGLRCSSCGAVHSADRKFCTLCGHALTERAADTFKEADSQRATVGGASKRDSTVVAVLAAVGMTAVGGIGWCVAAKFIGIGWMSFMAVGVCCLSGAGFYLCTQNRSVSVGILAALIGLMGILNGKTLIAKYVAMPQMRKFMTEGASQFGQAFESHPMKDQFYEEMIKNEDLMFAMAAMQLAEDGQIEEELVEDIVTERATGKKNPEKAEQMEEAEDKIRKALDSWDKKKRKEVAEAQYGKVSQKHMNVFMESEVGKTFSFIGAWIWSLSCQDIVWFPLGMFCAYRIARGEE